MYGEPLQYPFIDRLLPENIDQESRRDLDQKYQEVIGTREEFGLDHARLMNYGDTAPKINTYAGLFYRLGKGNLMKHVNHRRTKIIDYEGKEITVSYWGQTMGEKYIPHGLGLAVTETGNLIEASFDEGHIVNTFYRYIMGLGRQIIYFSN